MTNPRSRWGGVALVLAGWCGAAGAQEAAWRQQVGPEAGPVFLDVADGVVVAVSWSSELVAMESHTGRVLWRQEHPEVPGSSVLAAVSGGRAVSAVPERAEVVGRDLKSGEVVWRREVGGGVLAMQGCPGVRMVAVSHRGRGATGESTLLVHALDPADGRTLWAEPADGALVGRGPGRVFTASPAGWGAWAKGVTAWSCAKGEGAAIEAPQRELAVFLGASDRWAAVRHFERGFVRQVLCLTELDGRAQVCFPSSDGEVPEYGVTGALVRGDTVLFSTAHPTAHNLDPAPDGWVFRYDLKSRRLVARSAPFLSSGLFVDAGDQVVTAFGGTGIADHVHLLGEGGEPLGRLKLRKAPRQLAADAERAYVGSYDGQVVAIKLPRAGRKAAAELEVKPRFVAPPPPGPDLGWVKRTVFAAHPARAATSGTMGDGLISDVAFVDGETLLVGGNDDHVALWGVDGKRRWRSSPLGKDVQRVGVCDGGFAAQIYGGDVTVFRRSGEKVRALKPIRPGHGWAFGVTAACDVVVDDFGGNFTVFDGLAGNRIGAFSAPGVFDRRGVRVVGSEVVVSRDGALASLNLRGDLERPVAVWPTPEGFSGGRLAQAWRLPDGRLLREYVGQRKAVIEIVPSEGGPPERTIEVDVTGQGWMASVPSMIAVSPDGSTLAYFRRNLDLLLIDVSSGRRQPLSELAGPSSGILRAAFSPDGRRLAIAAYPGGHEVTLLERSR